MARHDQVSPRRLLTQLPLDKRDHAIMVSPRIGHCRDLGKGIQEILDEARRDPVRRPSRHQLTAPGRVVE